MHYELWDIRKDKTIYSGDLLDCIYFAMGNNLMKNNYHIAEICMGYIEPIELMTVCEWRDLVFDNNSFIRKITTENYEVWTNAYCYKLNVLDEISYFSISDNGKKGLILRHDQLLSTSAIQNEKLKLSDLLELI